MSGLNKGTDVSNASTSQRDGSIHDQVQDWTEAEERRVVRKYDIVQVNGLPVLNPDQARYDGPPSAHHGVFLSPTRPWQYVSCVKYARYSLF